MDANQYEEAIEAIFELLKKINRSESFSAAEKNEMERLCAKCAEFDRKNKPQEHLLVTFS